MKVVVVSYSLTGNNEALATSVAAQLAVKHIKVAEFKSRTMATIFLDILFSRTPKVNPAVKEMEGNDLVIFAGPVWIGQVAKPLRAYLSYLKNISCEYAFISISGGADGANLKIAGELNKRAGREPAAVIDLHIADLLPPEPKPNRKETSAYHLNDKDIKRLTNTIVTTLRQIKTS